MADGWKQAQKGLAEVDSFLDFYQHLSQYKQGKVTLLGAVAVMALNRECEVVYPSTVNVLVR